MTFPNDGSLLWIIIIVEGILVTEKSIPKQFALAYLLCVLNIILLVTDHNVFSCKYKCTSRAETDT